MHKKFLPWYNLKLIEFLGNYLTNKMQVFEYGGGNSTLFYANKVLTVSTIETREEWYNFVIKNSDTCNINIKLCNKLDLFYQEIENFNVNKFDLIIIDSRDRAKCLLHSYKFLKPNGIIILDNSERKNLQEAKQGLISKGFTMEEITDIRKDGQVSTCSLFRSF